MVENSGGVRLLHLNLGPRLLALMRDELKLMPRGVLVCKVAFIAVCAIFALDGKHPPARAQEPTAREFQQAVENATASARQAEKTDALKSRVDALDGRMSKQWDAVNANTNAIAGFQGETRVLLGLLGLLQGASFVVSRKKKAGES